MAVLTGFTGSDLHSFKSCRRGSCPLKRKSPASANQRGDKIDPGLALAELQALAGARLAVFLTFLHTRIAGEKSLCLESGTEVRIRFEEGARDAVPDRTGLAVRAAAGDIDADVVLSQGIRGHQRLQEMHALGFDHEVILHRATINRHLA